MKLSKNEKGLEKTKFFQKIKLDKITKKGKALYLAYDQGLEHGPTDFNDKNVDPKYIIDIAKKGKYNGIIFQKGIVERYYNEIKKSKVPLIIKLNGKTRLVKGDPIAPQLCSVKRAIELGAKAVGYTIYVGSIHEPVIFREFEKIEEEAYSYGIPVIAWVYPRGKAIKDELSRKTLAYAARVGLELGADMIKIKYNGNKKDLKWVIKSAGKVKVLIAGGKKTSEKKFLEEVKDIMQTGTCGLAVGRNVWQHKNPLEITAALRKIIFAL
ncbi:MAG: fructose-bisphosphate aldolase [Nanoarchaeota archaeon]|nr:fructose-bisphosphate aldolase [Nanoarchaeota archaeon]